MCPGLAYADKTTEERRSDVRCLVEEVRLGQKDCGMLGPERGHGYRRTRTQGRAEDSGESRWSRGTWRWK